jgi:putative hydrolase of HD superfamily
MDDQAFGALAALQGRIQTLKLLPRTGWLQRGMQNVESIAEHSFGVAALALIVGDLHPAMDRGRLLAIALVHDLAEALIGDLPASASRLIGKAAKHAAEQKAMVELLGPLPQGHSYIELWEEYSRGGSPEARLVKALDKLEMLAQALAYERAGARGLGEFWEDLEGWCEEFPLVRSLADQLLAEHEALTGEGVGPRR